MKKVLYSFVVVLLLSSCALAQKVSNEGIDKQKWLSSSEYRYKIASEFKLEEFLKGKSEAFIIDVFGPPDVREDSIMVYYLKIPANKSKFTGSKLIIFPFGYYPYKTIVINVEPSSRTLDSTKSHKQGR